jgi:hypothetical protein
MLAIANVVERCKNVTQRKKHKKIAKHKIKIFSAKQCCKWHYQPKKNLNITKNQASGTKTK